MPVPNTVDTTGRHNQSSRRIKLAITILCLYIALLLAAGAMFLGNQFIPHFIWVTLAYGMILCPLNIAFAKKTQKYIYRRIHRLVYADEELTVTPGELPAARRAVITIPWVAAGRDLLAWTVSTLIYCFLICLPYIKFVHDSAFPVDQKFWAHAFIMLAFPFAPLAHDGGTAGIISGCHHFLCAIFLPRRRV